MLRWNPKGAKRLLEDPEVMGKRKTSQNSYTGIIIRSLSVVC
jgi:hypothetical protein